MLFILNKIQKLLKEELVFTATVEVPIRRKDGLGYIDLHLYLNENFFKSYSVYQHLGVLNKVSTLMGRLPYSLTILCKDCVEYIDPYDDCEMKEDFIFMEGNFNDGYTLEDRYWFEDSNIPETLLEQYPKYNALFYNIDLDKIELNFGYDY